jgi:predicted lipoprotein with Yx(FWY)xxD motif
MRSTVILWIVVGLAVIVGAWYWMSHTKSTTGPDQTKPLLQANQIQQSVTPPTTNIVHSAKLGDYLVATNGMTLYRYTKDTAGVSNCSGTCAVNWPPYLRTTTAPLVAGSNATGTLATTMRTDGNSQITYNGVPLYFWKSDTKPGDTTGDGVGGVWFVVKP